MQMISSYNSYSNNSNNSNNKNILKYVIMSIVAVLIIVAVLVGAIYYLNSVEEKALKIYINGERIRNISEDIFKVQSNGEYYIAIKDIAKYLGYEAHNGEYKINSEETTKCYVENENETASFYLNSNKICKVAPNSSNEYDEYIISEPVKSIDNKLYVISEGIEKGLNVKFNYNSQKNSISIQTLSNIIASSENSVVQLNYKGLAEEFDNQKAALYGMYVVKNANEKYGVINSKAEEIIGCKYEKMLFNECAGEFIVTNALSKIGIILADGTNKISIEYDEINTLNKELYSVKKDGKYGVIDKNGKMKINTIYEDVKILDSGLGLFVVKYNGKYGVVDINDSKIIYWEYDSIGLDTKLYTSDNIKNGKLLFDSIIPVMKNKKWGLFDKTGNQILACEYDGFGCIPSASRDKIQTKEIVNNVLIVPELEGIVVVKDKKYGLVKKNGEFIFNPQLNAIFSTTSSGKNTYYINFTDASEKIFEYDMIWYLEQITKR